MSKHVPLILTLLLLCLASGCASLAPQAAPAPRTLTVYARVDEVTREVELELVRAFEAAHGVKVNLVSDEDPRLFTKFVTEKRNGLPTADVLAGWNPVGTLELQEQGWLTAYVPPTLRDRIPERFRAPVVIQHTGLTTLAYSPAKLGATPPPTSYADLVKPVYKDKVAMVDPMISTTALKLVGHLTYSAPLGEAYWEQMRANGLRLVGQWGQLPKDLADPNSPVAVAIAGYGRVYPDMLAGLPLKVVIPQEGLIAGEYVVAVATAAREPDLARAFVEEVTFHPRLLQAWAKLYLPVTVTGVDVPEGTPSLDRIIITDWKLIQRQELELKSRWQVIWSR